MFSRTSSPRRRPRSGRVCSFAIAALVAAGLAAAPVSALGQVPAPTTPAPTTPAPTTPAPATSDPAGQVTITAVGDTMLGNTPELPAQPYRYLDPVHDELTRNTQIVFMNLEGTLTSATGGKCGGGSSDCYAFRSPTSYAKVFAGEGVAVANSANNHYNDFGTQGQRDTAAALKGAGIVQTGRPGQIGYVTVGDVKVAFVGFAPYAWASSLLDLAAAKTLIQRAAGNADQVVVYMHAGAEGAGKTHITGSTEFAFGENRGNAKVFAHAAIDAGANLVVSSGPHVLRGMEYYRNRLIAYCLGNFAGFNNFSAAGASGRSAILRVTLGADGRFHQGRVFPLTLSAAGRPAPGGGALPMIQALSKADFGHAAIRFKPNGTIVTP